MQTIEAFFGEGGPLAARFPGYEARPQQVEVCQAIEQATIERKICIAEAPTGTGKGLAYLVPAVRRALERGERTVISTHTKGLQTQLMEKDIPLVLGLFPEAKGKVSACVLKGRSNYLCLHELDKARSDLFLLEDPLFSKVVKWAHRKGCTGDVATLGFSYPQWSEVTSTQDSCIGAKCGFYQECHYYKTRKEAEKHLIVIVNHALFMADLKMRADNEFASILPDYDHVIFDEAHHLESVATDTFGTEIRNSRIERLVTKIRKNPVFAVLDNDLLKTIEDLNVHLFAPFAAMDKKEVTLHDFLTDGEIQCVTEMATSLDGHLDILERHIRLLDLPSEETEPTLKAMTRARADLRTLFWVETMDVDGLIRWAHKEDRKTKPPIVTLRATPLVMADTLREVLWTPLTTRQGSATLISATLSTGRDFSYQRRQLGLPLDTLERIVGSPFDFPNQAMLYVPDHMPEPPKIPDESYYGFLADEIHRLVTASGGRAFLLFTAWKTLDAVFDRLLKRLPYPVLRQGDCTATELIRQFKEQGNAVLFGVATFWEGVDIAGDALSCVVIDKLPFAMPDNPVAKARSKAIELAGGSAFYQMTVPEATLKLKQGFGRLIRSQSDKGVVAILDRRLHTKPYGKAIVRSLPPAKCTKRFESVEGFWRTQQERLPV